MYQGYIQRVRSQKLEDYEISFKQFYYLPSVGDLGDIVPWSHHVNASFSSKEHKEDKSYLTKNCNAYVRLDGEQLFITQATHNVYSLLLRIIKTYHFPRQGVPTRDITFTSRPGDLISKDDFFILDSGLSVVETSFTNQNNANWVEMHPETVPSWLRSVIANHLSSSLAEWILYFNTERSGTHNNQWLLIDRRRVQTKSNIIWALDEAFSLTETTDMTPYLLENGFVGSYNMPISKTVYDKLGIQGSDYWTDPRAVILKRYHPRMLTIEDMKHWLVQNDEDDVRVGLAPRYSSID